jgi:hypothetical protein
MTGPIYEIVTYDVSDPLQADVARAAAQMMLQELNGFVAWTMFDGVEDSRSRVDLVVWENRESANVAAELVGSSPEFAEFRASVAKVVRMQHYRTMQHNPLSDDTEETADRIEMPVKHEDPCQRNVHHNSGVELGRFRLKPEVTEDDMRQAYRQMVKGYLSRSAGWQRQHLLKLEDGCFVDVAFSNSAERAKAICSSWQDSVECARFLAMIDPVSMEFGEIV